MLTSILILIWQIIFATEPRVLLLCFIADALKYDAGIWYLWCDLGSILFPWFPANSINWSCWSHFPNPRIIISCLLYLLIGNTCFIKENVKQVVNFVSWVSFDIHCKLKMAGGEGNFHTFYSCIFLKYDIKYFINR